jgi:hypothetical protein
MTISLVVELPASVYELLIDYLDQDSKLEDIDSAVTAAISDYVLTNHIKAFDSCPIQPRGELASKTQI